MRERERLGATLYNLDLDLGCKEKKKTAPSFVRGSREAGNKKGGKMDTNRSDDRKGTGK